MYQPSNILLIFVESPRELKWETPKRLRTGDLVSVPWIYLRLTPEQVPWLLVAE